MKRRFNDAEVGDLVYCEMYGDGIITHIQVDPDIIVKFHTIKATLTISIPFTIDGLYTDAGENAKPVLFYRNNVDRYLIERPEPEIDWNKVMPNTQFIVNNNENYEYIRKFQGFLNGKPWFNTNDDTVLMTWKNIKRLE